MHDKRILDGKRGPIWAICYKVARSPNENSEQLVEDITGHVQNTQFLSNKLTKQWFILDSLLYKIIFKQERGPNRPKICKFGNIHGPKCTCDVDLGALFDLTSCLRVSMATDINRVIFLSII